jgi:hypothetical protein
MSIREKCLHILSASFIHLRDYIALDSVGLTDLCYKWVN